MTAFRKVWSGARGSAIPLLLACLAGVAAGIAQPVIPTLLVDFANALWLNGNTGRNPAGAAACLALAIVSGLAAQMVQRMLIERVAANLSANFFTMGLHHMLSRPLEWFWAHHAGGMHVRLERSSRGLAELIRLLATDVLPPIAALATAMLLMWQLSQRAATVCMFVFLALVALTLAQIHSQSGVRVRINRARELLGDSVVEAAGGIEQVKLFGAESREAQRVGTVAARLADTEFAHHRTMAKFDFAKQLTESVGAVALLAHVWFFGGGVSFPSIATALLLYQRMFEPVRHLHRLMDESHERWALSKDLIEILMTPAVQMKQPQVADVPVRVDLDAVSFRYPNRERNAIQQVSAQILPGERVAIVGHSASGKSTLAKLLTGLLAPSTGTVSIGGTAPAEMRDRQILPSIGYMTQEAYLFAGTVVDNVRFARTNATDAEVVNALDLAGLRMTPDGTVPDRVGPSGAGLSGGQKQRVMLARVLLMNPQVIVFDEPSAALDATAAKRFFTEVLSALQGKTVLVITHDTANLAWADQVLEMTDGMLLARSQSAA